MYLSPVAPHTFSVCCSFPPPQVPVPSEPAADFLVFNQVPGVQSFMIFPYVPNSGTCLEEMFSRFGLIANGSVSLHLG